MKETPEVPRDDPKTWANVNDFGADPNGQTDSSAAIQKATDSGATTMFLPGNYSLKSTVVIRGKVRRVVGIGGMIDYTAQVRPDLRIVDGEAPVVMLEHFAYIHGGLEVDTRRTLVLRSVSDCDVTSTARAEGSEWFFEDVVTHNLTLKRQKLWARQLNIENEGTHTLPTTAATFGFSATRPSEAARCSTPAPAVAAKFSAVSATPQPPASSRRCS